MEEELTKEDFEKAVKSLRAANITDPHLVLTKDGLTTVKEFRKRFKDA